MRKIITPVLLMILLNMISNYSFAQIDEKDFVIDLSGTIISGEIHSPLDPRRYKVVNFTGEDKVESIYKPEDILGFGLTNGARYRSGIHPNSGEMVFFEEIIVGERSLLSHKGHLFIELKEGLRRLEFRKKKEVQMRQVNTESFGYIGLLTYGLGNNMEYEFVETIKSVPPKKNAIKELFREYYRLNGNEYEEFGAEYPFLKISPNVGVGYFQMYQYMNGTRATLHQVKSSLGINVLVDFHLVRDAPRVFFTSGLVFQKFNNVLDLNFPVSLGRQFIIYEDFDLNSVGLPFLFNYYLIGNKRFKMHSGIGLNYRILNKITNESITELRRNNGDLVSTFTPQLLKVSNNIGLMMRLGITTSISSKTALVLEGQIHRISRFGEIFATYPSEGGLSWYKNTFNGYSLNAAVKF